MEKEELLPNEELKGVFSPRMLSFISAFIPYLYLFGVGITLLFYSEQIYGLAKYLWILGPFVQPYLNSVIFSLLIMIPAIIIGLLKINVKIILIFLSSLILGLYIDFQGFQVTYKLYLLVCLGILGIILVDINRRSHKYYITNFRIISKRSFPRYNQREIMLEKIQDIAVQQGLFGKIFNFGNIIPTSASGIGTGTDHSEINLGVGTKIPKTPIGLGIMVGGGKGITGFRARPHNCLYGVPDPSKTSTLISRMKYNRSEATKLDEIKQILDKRAED